MSLIYHLFLLAQGKHGHFLCCRLVFFDANNTVPLLKAYV